MSAQLEVIKQASTFIDQKKYLQAKKILLDFLNKSKNVKVDIKFFYTLYLVSNGLKEIQNAKKYLEKCLKINDQNHVILNNLGNIYLKEGNLFKAENLYLKSFNLKKNYLLVIVNLAIFYQNLGKLNESKKFYLKAIELSPKRISIYFNLSRIDKNFIDDEKVKYLSNLMSNEKQEQSEMSYGYFILAEDQRKKKNYDKEIEYLIKANEFAFESMFETNSKMLNYWKHVIPKNYKNFKFTSEIQTNKDFENLKPIFILGLPRSGSTVTEAILSSANKNIITLGESSIINGIIAKDFSTTENLLLDLNLMTEKVIEIFKDKNLNFKNKSFIDKSLENFFYIDVILKIFPKAKFVNTTRNIDDNIFAIFKQSLSKLSWTHSIKDILEYSDSYISVINYFLKKYPGKIFNIKLEDLTSSPEKVSKDLYSFCSLDWSDKVLDFYNREDLLISTASNIQIRDKIKKYDNDKYKPYKILLKNFSKKYKWLS